MNALVDLYVQHTNAQASQRGLCHNGNTVITDLPAINLSKLIIRRVLTQCKQRLMHRVKDPSEQDRCEPLAVLLEDHGLTETGIGDTSKLKFL